MTPRGLVFAALALAATTCGACQGAPVRPAVDLSVGLPGPVMDFRVLYGTNCAGCHGPNGEGGVALGLDNPIYLAIANEAMIRRITANGVAGTAMPAFAQASGGLLTDAQVDAIARGIRARWGRPAVLDGAELPPYAALTPGDPTRGVGVYRHYCSSCHGAAGLGGPRGGSIVDGSYLALVSDQSLRTTMIAGRPDLGHPDWRADVPGTPMSPEDVSDVAAWLSAQRPQFAALGNRLRKETR
jgi:cytochrome c oxidase cbb3-type subunit 3